MKILSRFTFGVGDRFGHQAMAQLRAFQLAAEAGLHLVPVWNKSNREHTIIGTEPSATRVAVDAAIDAVAWKGGYHLDADHINLSNVDRFLAPCDFFTLDVADAIGQPADEKAIDAFVMRHPELIGTLSIAGIEEPFSIDHEELKRIAEKFLHATAEAGAIYRHIRANKVGDAVIEVSMDETDVAQTPAELLVILAALADEQIPLQTIAPKFTGRFNKGVDYVGDLVRFEKEFDDDLAVIAHAVREYGLPATLKLSVHSGSDKFSLYPVIRKAIERTGAGLHVKTAGTTWLEELIGLAEAGGDGLALAKQIYAKALAKKDELCRPYATVIDIEDGKLPSAQEVHEWTSEQYVRALRHDPTCEDFNPHFRQLLHVGFKVAAQLGETYTAALVAYQDVIGRNVTGNLFERHIRPLFL